MVPSTISTTACLVVSRILFAKRFEPSSNLVLFVHNEQRVSFESVTIILLHCCGFMCLVAAEESEASFGTVCFNLNMVSTRQPPAA